MIPRNGYFYRYFRKISPHEPFHPQRGHQVALGYRPSRYNGRRTGQPRTTRRAVSTSATRTPLEIFMSDDHSSGALLRKLSRQDPDANPNQLWNDQSIRLKFKEDASDINFRYAPHFWLRDNCRCSSCINGDTMQRAFDTFTIPANVVPKQVLTGPDALEVHWAHDDHVSHYPYEWLHRQLAATKEEKAKDHEIEFWDSTIKGKEPSVHYDEIMADDKGVGKWTSKIRKYGFCYVDACPVSPEKTQELLERISFIRLTHYGGFYDFTSDLTMKDTAYTSLALNAHTDTTYFTDPAGLQMFHLLSHSDGAGGESLLVDGFHAAKKLYEMDWQAFKSLARNKLVWHASGNEGITITPGFTYPILNLGQPAVPGSDKGWAPFEDWDLRQVRWNNDDRGVYDLRAMDVREMDSRLSLFSIWSRSVRKWDEILKSSEMEYWAQMKPGRPLIFDNWRVLHGRSAFTGKRRICGGYINHDDFISRWRNTNYGRKEVLDQIL